MGIHLEFGLLIVVLLLENVLGNGHYNPAYIGYHETIEFLLTFCGVLSAIGSLSVLSTGIFFWDVLVKGKVYKQMIIMIAGCNLVSSIAASLATPSNPGLCTTQAVLTYFFYRSTWMWSCFIVLTLWCYINKGTEFMTFRNMNILAWSINILFELLPFTTATYYGEDDDRLGKSICSFMSNAKESKNGSTQRDKDIKAWIIILHYFPMILCVIIMAVLLVLLWKKVRVFNSTAGSPIRALVRSTALYPLITMLSWIPNCIAFLIAEFYFTTKPSEYVYYNYIFLPTRLSYCLAILSGMFYGIIFFAISKEARDLWHGYFYPNLNLQNVTNPLGKATDVVSPRSSYYEGEMGPVSDGNLSMSSENQENELKYRDSDQTDTSSPMW